MHFYTTDGMLLEVTSTEVTARVAMRGAKEVGSAMLL
jgi:hypothetical protein